MTLYVACEGGEYAKLDRTGHVIDLQPGIPDDSAPYVSGCYVGQVQKGDVIKNQDVLGLLDFLSKLKPDLKKRITEIAMDDQKSIKIFLEGGVHYYQNLPERGRKNGYVHCHLPGTGVQKNQSKIY